MPGAPALGHMPVESPRARRTTGSLSARQREIARLLARGLTNRQIATQLGLSAGTVANYVRALLGQLGLTSRSQVAAWAVEQGVAATQDRLLNVLERLLAIEDADLTSVLAAASQPIAQALHADKVDIFLLEPTRETLVAVGASDTPLAHKQRAIGLDRMPLANGGIAVETFLTGVSRLNGHVDQDQTELIGVREALGVRSSLTAPIEVSGERRGVLSVTATAAERFTERDLRFVESVARWVGVLTHRAELVTDAVAAAAEAGRRTAAEELIAVVAHDVRNYLAPMRGNLQLLQRRAHREERVRDMDNLDALGRSLDRMQRLVLDLLDTSRLDRGVFALDLQPVDVATLARDAARSAATPNVAIDVDAPDEVTVVADPDRVRQALDNLLANAVQHSHAGGRVSVCVNAAVDGHGVDCMALKVSNRGTVVPREVLRRLFERFAVGPGSDGLGLGLYLARGIATAHGGSLDADSTPESGTTFTLVLPVTAEACPSEI